MLNKYIFTNQNYKPICIAFYSSDEVALQEAEKLAYEKDQVVYAVRHLTKRGADLSHCPRCGAEQGNCFVWCPEHSY